MELTLVVWLILWVRLGWQGLASKPLSHSINGGTVPVTILVNLPVSLNHVVFVYSVFVYSFFYFCCRGPAQSLLACAVTV